MLNIALHSCARGGAAETYPLDGVSNIWSARSFRKLLSSYSGDIGLVRRDSDNAELSFNATEWADGTLAAWVGVGNNGYLATHYDQSGNGRDWTQTTAADQPLVVENGVVVTHSGMPGWQSGLSGQYMVGPATSSAVYSVFHLDIYTGAEYSKLMLNASEGGRYYFSGDSGSTSTTLSGQTDPELKLDSSSAYWDGVQTDFAGKTRGEIWDEFINVDSSPHMFSWLGVTLNWEGNPQRTAYFLTDWTPALYNFEHVILSGAPSDSERDQIFNSQKNYAGIS